ncbi:putative capsid protein [Termite associated circular virus 2]|uniref:Putative capsid protein n=1 Tax=Termite associated circular virus 2 TaxID=2108550 RepID=A0A2P1E313_9VIRU|nr:putative capsid protein [Termite associated circular virus 2]AVK87310.1 putative capsid protein [Termite associated circular virus 2]
MAYGRRRLYSSRVKTRTGISGRRGRYSTRRYVKTRPLARRTYRRRRTTMSRRKILNISSEKKKDTMLTWTNLQGSVGVETPGPAKLAPPSPDNLMTEYCVVFSPTHRGATFSSGSHGSKYYKQLRTSSLCYWRGIREVVTLKTDGPGAWEWRRICFTMKGEDLYTGDRYSFDLGTSPVARITSDGMKRAFFSSENALRTRDAIFDGNRNVDWADVITAKVDTELITPLYDRRMLIRSGNEAGTVRIKKCWHAMNKNLQYDDDENGESMLERYYSTEGKPGMGDYYIVDLFQAVVPQQNVTPTNLYVNIEATAYWHER